jgi:ParB/Sulfiredoxin domain
LLLLSFSKKRVFKMSYSARIESRVSEAAKAQLFADIGTVLGNRKVEMMPLDRIVPSKHNARTHSQRQIGQIADSIRRFGFTCPVLIGDGGEIITGHGRVAAAKLLGLSSVPTLQISHLSPTERRAYAIADNRLAEQAGWDSDMLAVELQALLDLEFDVELTGFAADEIALVVDHSSQCKAETKPRTKSRAANRKATLCFETAVSRPGDVWLLGNHRLVCGDDAMAEADAILRRWRDETGKQPILTATGETLSDIMAQRESPTSGSDTNAPLHTPAMREVQ